MNWRSYLRTRTRQPEFLWRLVLGILVLGVMVGYVAEQVWQPSRISFVDSTQGKPPQSVDWDALEALATAGHWLELWWALLPLAFRGFTQPGPAALSILTGLCWLAFLLQALRVRGLGDVRLWLALAGVALGVLSVWPTDFFILWQEETWNLRESDQLVAGLRFYIFGVGLREELAKLLLLLPLLPWLRRVQSDLCALVVSACVGLGFAVAENVGYFAVSSSSTAGRFVVANPLHFALTGLVGLAVYRALGNPRGWGPHAVATFLIMVVAHGVYDAVISLPALSELSMGSLIVFALVIYQFFHELRELRPAGGDVVSLSATFLCGVSIVAASTFVYLSATVGCAAAFDMLVQGILGLAVMVYLFLREIPESLVGV